MLGSIKYPDDARLFKKRLKDKLHPSELLIQRFSCYMWSKGKVQMASGGKLYLTHLSLTFVSKNGISKAVVHVPFSTIQDLRKKDDGIEISLEQGETRIFDRFRDADVAQVMQLITFHWHSVLQKLVTPFVLVIGANTAIGMEVVRYLTVSNVEVRAVVLAGLQSSGASSHHDCTLVQIPPLQDSQEQLEAAGVEVVEIDLDAADVQQTLQRVFVGAEKLLLCTELLSIERDTVTVTSALRTHLASCSKPVKHIVSILPFVHGFDKSLLEGFDGCKDSLQMEESCKVAEAAVASLKNICYNILRVGRAMQSIPCYTATKQGQIFLPMGEGAVRWVDLEDVAKAASTLLSTSRHVSPNKTFELQGLESLTGTELAKSLSTALRRQIELTCVDAAYVRSYVSERVAEEHVDTILQMHYLAARGVYSKETSDLAELLPDREPSKFQDFARRNASKFRTVYRMYFSQVEQDSLYSPFSRLCQGQQQMTLDALKQGLGRLLGAGKLAQLLFRIFDVNRRNFVEFEEYLHIMSLMVKGYGPLALALALTHCYTHCSTYTYSWC